jgi:hypothetical protein
MPVDFSVGGLKRQASVSKQIEPMLEQRLTAFDRLGDSHRKAVPNRVRQCQPFGRIQDETRAAFQEVASQRFVRSPPVLSRRRVEGGGNLGWTRRQNGGKPLPPPCFPIAGDIDSLEPDAHALSDTESNLGSAGSQQSSDDWSHALEGQLLTAS